MNQKEFNVLLQAFPPSLPLLKEAVGDCMYPTPASHTIATSPILLQLSEKYVVCWFWVFFLDQ